MSDTSTPRYVTPWRGIRLRVTLNPWWEWSLGIGRTVWPGPLPHGMTLYVVHLVRWNLLLERSRS